MSKTDKFIVIFEYTVIAKRFKFQFCRISERDTDNISRIERLRFTDATRAAVIEANNLANDQDSI